MDKEHMAKKRVLVTGATGSIGQHLVPMLLSRGDEVFVVSRSPEKFATLTWGNEVTVLQSDFWDKTQVLALYEKVKPDEIYHLAASVMQWGKTDGLEMLSRVNILGTATLMESLEVIPDAHFVYPGSFAELGGKAEPIREDHEPDPQEFYSISKLAGTLMARQLAKNKGYNIVVGRIFTAYGPNIPIERLMGQILARAKRNEDITLVHQDISRDFVYVTDIARALMELAEKANKHRGEIFNVASGEKTTLLELYEVVKDITGTKSKVNWQPERRTTYDKLPWQADMRKVRQSLDWKPEVSLSDGIRKTIAWMEEEQN